MVQRSAANGQQRWYSHKCVFYSLTWQTVPHEDVTAGDLHQPVAQGTFGEILTAIVMISHRSVLDLPSAYYCKKNTRN